MPFEIHRIAKALYPVESKDGTIKLMSPDDLPFGDVVRLNYERHLRDGSIDPVGEIPTRSEMLLAVAKFHMESHGGTELDLPLAIGAVDWHWLLEVARKHGWKPKGTSEPIAFVKGRWKGSYVIPGGQGVSEADVQNLRRALTKALQAPDRALRGIAEGPVDEKPHDVIQRFLEYTNGPYELMIW